MDGYLGGLGVPGPFRGALDVHAVAAGVVQLSQLHELEHLHGNNHNPSVTAVRALTTVIDIDDRSMACICR
jgi:hypothetical protein